MEEGTGFTAQFRVPPCLAWARASRPAVDRASSRRRLRAMGLRAPWRRGLLLGLMRADMRGFSRCKSLGPAEDLPPPGLLTTNLSALANYFSGAVERGAGCQPPRS